jgi:hypothetical protein
MPSTAILYSPFDELDDRFTNAHRFGRPRHPELLLLRPNKRALLLLCPLLPPSPTHTDAHSARARKLRLPAEAWQRVLSFAMEAEDDAGPADEMGKVRFLIVCKSFQVSSHLRSGHDSKAKRRHSKTRTSLPRCSTPLCGSSRYAASTSLRTP